MGIKIGKRLVRKRYIFIGITCCHAQSNKFDNSKRSKGGREGGGGRGGKSWVNKGEHEQDVKEEFLEIQKEVGVVCYLSHLTTNLMTSCACNNLCSLGNN